MADVITRFKLETTQYDSKLRDSAKGLADYARVASVAGKEFDKFTKDQAEAARALGSISTSANNAKDKVKELVGAYNQAANAYNALTKEQQQSDWGRALAESINTLKGRITEAKQELYSMNDAMNKGKFGQFGGIIDDIGHKIGISGNLTEMLTSKTALLTGAIGAGAAIVGKAAKEWADYNAELAKQDQITQVTTGLKGDDANNMTDKMRALSDTYKVDFRDAINAANTLMSQFGESGESAIQLIKDGMQGMIQGDGPKLLSMIQQYAPAFRDAGISASQLVAVIQNSEGGIFTDQNMQAIVMGIKNIRLMTNATSEALAKLGIDGQKMSEQMSNGSMTVFDALKQVAGELKNVDSNSKTAGEVMQTVFGRQGAMAGTNLARAIEGLNTDLEQTKKQTGEVGDALADLQTANERLNTAIRDCFEYDGWDQMANGIRSNLITALAAVIEKLAEIRDFFTGENQIKWDVKPKPGVNNVADDPNVDANGNYIRKPNKGGTIKVVRQTVTPDPIVKPTKPTKPTGGNKTPKTEEQLNNEQIQKLTQEYIKASDERRKAIEGEIKTLQDRNKEIARLKDMALGKIGDDGSLSAMTQQLKELQSAQSESASGREWDDYQKKIEDVTAKINVLKGVLPKDQQATFTVEVNAGQLEQLRMLLPSDEETVRINVEEGRIGLPDIPTEIEQVVNTKVGDVVTPEIAKELTQVVNVEPGTVNLPKIPKEDETIRVNITATTADAMKEVRDMVGEIEGWQVAIEPKIEIKEQDLRTPFEKLKDSLKIEIAEENMQVDTTTLQTLMKTAIQNGIDGLDPNFSALQEKMREGMNIPDETWQALQDQINEKLKGLGIEPIKIDFKTGNIANDGKGGGNKSDVDRFKNFNDKLSQLNGGVGSIVSGIQQMGVEIPKELQSTLSVLQGISTIMTGVLAIMTVMNAKQTAQTAMSFIPFFAHGGLVHAATGYMVPGNDHSDRTLIAASSGELILNRAQQGVIASQLENGNGGGMHVVGEIQGEKIVLVANRFLKRSGQGELVTWK